MKKGFATIYIVLILGTLTAAILIIIEVASGFAAASVCRTIGMSVGQSLLGQYSNELYNRYGIFALRGYEDDLTSEAKSYASASTELAGKPLSVFSNSLKASSHVFVKPKLSEIKVYTDAHPALDVEAFAKQLDLLAVPALIKRDDASIASDHEQQREIGIAEKRCLPSTLLGIKERSVLSLPNGLFENTFEKLAQDEYILSQCGNNLHSLRDTWLTNEVEYIIYGKQSDEDNLNAVKTAIAALLAVKNGIENLAEDGAPIEIVSGVIFIIDTAYESSEELERLMAGETVGGLDYQMCLRILLKLLPKKEKLARLMDIMQMNVRNVDHAAFSFANYCYGFELRAVFTKGVVPAKSWGYSGRKMELRQTHVYR